MSLEPSHRMPKAMPERPVFAPPLATALISRLFLDPEMNRKRCSGPTFLLNL